MATVKRMSLTKSIFKLATSVSRLWHVRFIPTLNFTPEFQLAGFSNENVASDKSSLASLFDEAILRMGVPKSKISPSRKRMKHKQHIPDKVSWVRCVKCGESKLPHRICTKHVDICAMRDGEWAEHQAKKGVKSDETL